MLETLDELVAEGRIVARRRGRQTPLRSSAEEAAQNVVKAIGKGLLKTISKMGISTIQSYRGAQIFEAVGLERELIDKHFTGTASRIGGVGVDVLAPRRSSATRAPIRRVAARDELLPVGGVYAWRRDGEHHMWNPETIALVQHAVRAANGDVGGGAAGRPRGRTRRCARAPRSRSTASTRATVNEDAARRATLRGLLRDRRRPSAARRRSRSRRSSRRARSSSASAPAR